MIQYPGSTKFSTDTPGDVRGGNINQRRNFASDIFFVMVVTVEEPGSSSKPYYM